MVCNLINKRIMRPSDFSIFFEHGFLNALQTLHGILFPATNAPISRTRSSFCVRFRAHLRRWYYCKPFGNCRFSLLRDRQQEQDCFCTTRKNLHRTTYFGISTNNRIDFSKTSQFRKILRKFFRASRFHQDFWSVIFSPPRRDSIFFEHLFIHSRKKEEATLFASKRPRKKMLHRKNWSPKCFRLFSAISKDLLHFPRKSSLPWRGWRESACFVFSKKIIGEASNISRSGRSNVSS